MKRLTKLSTFIDNRINDAINSDLSTNGGILFTDMTVTVKVDYEACKKLTESMGISLKNVAAYLRRRYKYERDFQYLNFIKSTCLLKADQNEVFFKNSELHKIFTDILFVLNEQDIKADGKILTLHFQTIKMNPMDLLIYTLGRQASEFNTELVRIIAAESFKDILLMGKKSFKRKFLRPHVARQNLEYRALSNLVSDRDFSEDHINSLIEKFNHLPKLSSYYE